MKPQPLPRMALDASSAIILYETGMLSLFMEAADVVTTQTVADECLAGPQGEQIAELLKPVIIADVPQSGAFDKGENTILTLQAEGAADAVLSDDGAVLVYCKREGIPHYNALMIPVCMGRAGLLDKDMVREQMNRIQARGRYAGWVIDYAYKQLKDLAE